MNLLYLRLCGALLVTAAGGLGGHAIYAARKRRVSLLRELAAGLGRLADELELTAAPLDEIFERLRERPFFDQLSKDFDGATLARSWRRAAMAQPLDTGSKTALSGLAETVGRCGAGRQVKELELVRRRLDEAASALERDLAIQGRTLTGLGAALGALLTLILL